VMIRLLYFKLVPLNSQEILKLSNTQAMCFSMRKANKVIMTMVTLLGNPAKSASPLTQKTLLPPCLTLPKTPESNPTPQPIKTHLFTRPAGLRDISMHVPTTAAVNHANDANDDDEDCFRPHPSIVTDDNLAITPAFIQQWEAFYTDNLKLIQKYGILTSSTNAGKYAPMPTISPVDDDQDPNPTSHSSLDDLSEELINHINSPSTSPPPTTTNKDTPHPTND